MPYLEQSQHNIELYYFRMQKNEAMEFRSMLSYPDPFVPSGIEFVLPEDAVVSLKIIDHEGKDVMMLIEKKGYKAGRHVFVRDLSSYAGKKYLYRLTARIQEREYAETKRVG